MAEMKFKFTIQPYQTEAVDSVVGVFAGQPFNDHFTYRRDVEIKRDVTNWMPSDEELYMGFANAKVQLDYGQLLDNIHRIQARNNIKLSDSLKSGGLGVCSHGNIKFEAYLKSENRLCQKAVSQFLLCRCGLRQCGQLSAPVRYYEQAIKSHKKCTPA